MALLFRNKQLLLVLALFLLSIGLLSSVSALSCKQCKKKAKKFLKFKDEPEGGNKKCWKECKKIKKFKKGGCKKKCCQKICKADTAKEGCESVGICVPVTDAPTEATPTEKPTFDGPTDKPTIGVPTDKPTADGPTDKPTIGVPTDKPTADGPTDPPTIGVPTDKPTADAYEFDSKFGEGSSVSYAGQIARQVLINKQKGAVGGISFGSTTGEVEAEILKYYVCDGSDCDNASPGISVDSPLTVTQDDISDISDGKDLKGKIAGQDPTGQHKVWDTEFVGWNQWGGVTPESPDNLVRHWAAVVDDLASNTPGTDPNGDEITKAFVSAAGQDYQQLIQKFVLGAVTFSQGADDYMDNDIDGKGLKAQNSASSGGSPGYTALEHAWDEGYGYFGGAINYAEYTDEEIAGKGGRSDYENGYNDYDGNGQIDLRYEMNFGHSINAAKRDLGAATGVPDFTAEAWDGFYQGRLLIANAVDDLTAVQLAELIVFRDKAVGAWEKAIAATVVHYINDCLDDIAEPTLDFYDYAKHWSEAKGFSLSFQFNRLSPLSDPDFATLQTLLRDSPEIDLTDNPKFVAWQTELLEARDLLEAAYGFDSADVADW